MLRGHRASVAGISGPADDRGASGAGGAGGGPQFSTAATTVSFSASVPMALKAPSGAEGLRETATLPNPMRSCGVTRKQLREDQSSQ